MSEHPVNTFQSFADFMKKFAMDEDLDRDQNRGIYKINEGGKERVCFRRAPSFKAMFESQNEWERAVFNLQMLNNDRFAQLLRQLEISTNIEIEVDGVYLSDKSYLLTHIITITKESIFEILK